MQSLGILLLAFAVSIDGFVVGVVYGMRGIRIPLLSLLIMNAASALMISISMSLGRHIGIYIGQHASRVLGGGILIFLGSLAILNGRQERDRQVPKRDIIHLLKMPEKADVDQSGAISIIEALPLGIALAMDAFGAGLGAGVIGYWSHLAPLVVGAIQFLLVFLGTFAGRVYLARRLSSTATFLPGGILIMLGIVKLF